MSERYYLEDHYNVEGVSFFLKYLGKIEKSAAEAEIYSKYAELCQNDYKLSMQIHKLEWSGRDFKNSPRMTEYIKNEISKVLVELDENTRKIRTLELDNRIQDLYFKLLSAAKKEGNPDLEAIVTNKINSLPRHIGHSTPQNPKGIYISKESIQKAILASEQQAKKAEPKVEKAKKEQHKVSTAKAPKQKSAGILDIFFKNRNYKKNSSRLISICQDLIENYQHQSCKPSCTSDLITLIKSRVLNAKDEISNWKDYDTDYIQIAHTMLAHATFDLLASGKYHLYRGMLNPMSCAENMMDVYKASMEYAFKKNFIDEKTQKEQFEFLMKCISEVG